MIPTRSNQPRERFIRSNFGRRNVGERCVGWQKNCHRTAIPYDKFAVHYLSFVTLAMIQLCMRLLHPPNRT